MSNDPIARLRETGEELPQSVREELLPLGLSDEPLPAFSRKVGRNDPCQCGSGKKYKKCCLDADEAARSSMRADALGPRAQMAEYAKPIIDVTNGSAESIREAIDIAKIFWNLAVLRDDAMREGALREALVQIDEASRADFEETARMMLERHRAMFPEMHES
jgi:SEC-C motif